ncbi:hypothetical protein [Neobacillus sp. D3-1R]|uniref:hypothetical protein n=1 Tax=Neobacillus sp. D3-1R TaxID=3445778 RepID=UPI003F9F8E75
MRRRGFVKFIVVLLVPILMYSIDYGLVSAQKRPLFVIKTAMYKDGGTKLYQGLGYKVIDYNKLEGRQDIVFQSFFLNIGKPD